MTDAIHDPRTRWPRLTAAVARSIAGPRPTSDDLADAAEAIGDYEVWRASAPTDPTTGRLRDAIRHAVEAR